MTRARPLPEPALREAHAQGLLNQQLADHFEISLSHLKRALKALGLRSHQPANRIGRLGEQLVTQAFTALGHSVKVMPYGSPFDLRVAGQRVDVKTSVSPKADGRYAFRLKPVHASGEYSYPKNYFQDTDFLVLVCLQDDALLHVYVVPVARWKPDLTVRPGSPFDPLGEYRDAWRLLAAHPVAA